MAIVDRNTLKQWFKRGAKPLASQFASWIDSFWHKSEKIPSTQIDGLQNELDKKSDKKSVDNQIKDILERIENIKPGLKVFVCGGDDEFIWKTKVRFEDVTISDSIFSVSFKIGDTVYDSLVGVELPGKTMLEILVDLKAGFEKGVINVEFMEV